MKKAMKISHATQAITLFKGRGVAWLPYLPQQEMVIFKSSFEIISSGKKITFCINANKSSPRTVRLKLLIIPLIGIIKVGKRTLLDFRGHGGLQT